MILQILSVRGNGKTFTPSSISNKMKLASLLSISVFVAVLGLDSALAVTPEEFAEAAGEKAASVEGVRNSVDGAAKGWKFLDKELRHLASEGGDPSEIIVQYDKELKALGVRMILVPVPAKANVYPEKFMSGADASSVTPNESLLKKLAEAGVEVVDLEPVFAKLKEEDADKLLYCAQDSHWSPYACEVVADILVGKIGDAEWLAKDDSIKIGEVASAKFHGDLLSDEEKSSWPMEELPMRKVKQDGERIELNPDSPVLLVGDSHTLVFSDGGDMHTMSGGITDHLMGRLGIAIDRMASRASGAHTARVDIARRAVADKEMWGKKKVFIWCFSAREFSLGTWRKLPAQP